MAVPQSRARISVFSTGVRGWSRSRCTKPWAVSYLTMGVHLSQKQHSSCTTKATTRPRCRSNRTRNAVVSSNSRRNSTVRTLLARPCIDAYNTEEAQERQGQSLAMTIATDSVTTARQRATSKGISTAAVSPTTSPSFGRPPMAGAAYQQVGTEDRLSEQNPVTVLEQGTSPAHRNDNEVRLNSSAS